MLSNNIRDRVGDEESGRKTIAILLGHDRAVNFLASMFIVAYVLTAIFIIIGILPIISIIVFLTVKMAFDVIKGYQGKTEPLEMMPAMVKTGQTNTAYGFLLGLSLLVSTFF